MQQQPAGTDRRSLLATTTSASSLNPTLECDGCPDTDTRVRVNDTTQFPWTAVGMVTRDQQGAISRSACLTYVAFLTDVLPRACYVLSNIDAFWLPPLLCSWPICDEETMESVCFY